jgi:TetR/AcrR family transcriptional regulator
MPAKNSGRKQRERQLHKQAVMEVALALFAEKGFHDVSVQEIAEQSEFSVGTLYNLFGNKDGLFEELLETTKERVHADLFETMDTPGEPVECIRHFILSMPDILEKYATFLKVHVSELGKKGSKAAKLDDDFNATMNARLAQIIAAGISKGQFRPVDPMIAAQALGAVMETLAFEMAGHFNKDEAIDTSKKVEQLFIDGLLAQGGPQ